MVIYKIDRRGGGQKSFSMKLPFHVKIIIINLKAYNL